MQRPNPNQQLQQFQQQQQKQSSVVMQQQSSTSSSVQQQSQQFMSQQFSQQQQFSSQQQTMSRQVTEHSSVSRQVTQQRVQQQGGYIQQTSTPAITSAPQTPSAQLYQQQTPSYLVQSPGIPADASPPVFEQIFKNSRFAQGGNALFEGKLKGNPKPEVSWTRKGAPLFDSSKHKLSYNPSTGVVSLLINQIGPGDEGEYTCKARNAVGEAICSVFIQPEGMPAPQFQQIKREQQLQQQVLQQKQVTSQQQYTNGYSHIEEEFKVDTFEYRLLREVSFRESITRRYGGETDAQIITTVDRALGLGLALTLVLKTASDRNAPSFLRLFLDLGSV